MGITSFDQHQLEVIHWGLIDYQTALDRQIELAQKVFHDNLNGYLVVCTHPPVVTVGRKTQAGDIYAWNGSVIEVARGGRATYHGPNQIIVYPIINLKFERHQRKVQDVWGLIRAMENSMIQTLERYHIEAHGKSIESDNHVQRADSQTNEETGVWVKHQKIASIGIGVKNWVSYHGLAINVEHDPNAFYGMNPCGFQNSIMTSLEAVLNKTVDRDEFQNLLIQDLLTYL